eukprot:TRINITY_DN8118_c0_g1_i2.p1 TRINITY_DN8118_c0_g1~~TRINITY_DN8118_c0_g1_i2.p1  ORF type:complete len:419 (+),score=71.98 TRINITY_DN8118_c0_g1_i2:162-1418(+)
MLATVSFHPQSMPGYVFPAAGAPPPMLHQGFGTTPGQPVQMGYVLQQPCATAVRWAPQSAPSQMRRMSPPPPMRRMSSSPPPPMQAYVVRQQSAGTWQQQQPQQQQQQQQARTAGMLPAQTERRQFLPRAPGGSFQMQPGRGGGSLQGPVGRTSAEMAPVKKASSGLQESDMLEKMTATSPAGLLSREAEAVQLVSLGGSCAPKLSFQQLGRGAETLPFDWLTTKLEGVAHFIANNFKGYFDYTTTLPTTVGRQGRMFRTKYHSFWHDDPTDPGMREKYTRRFERFNAIDARSKPVLFVRAVTTKADLQQIRPTMQILRERFGEGAHLLVIFDGQLNPVGPIAVKDAPGKLLLYFHKFEDREPSHAPYMKPVREALEWVLGNSLPSGPLRAMHLDEALRAVIPSDWGSSMGGIDCFEA